MSGPRVPRHQLLAIAAERAHEVRDFLEFAANHERAAERTGERHRSLRLENRPDIRAAARAAALFPEAWWGITVYTCFGSECGAKAVAETFRRPLPGPAAEALLAAITLPRGAIGHHRIQPGHTGAKKALAAASDNADLFHNVLTDRGTTFEQRYARIRSAHLPQWGRTTTFDLVLRAGALGISGETYGPETAFLEGSTGPRRGFERIFGTDLHERGADWGEALLWSWTAHWSDVAAQVGVDWEGAPYNSGDFENALCIYQER
jgi:hypothetical protein